MDKQSDEWISIRDRMPEPGQKVKIANIDERAVYLTYNGIQWLQEITNVQFMHVPQPTHWMPAEEDSNEEE